MPSVAVSAEATYGIVAFVVGLAGLSLVGLIVTRLLRTRARASSDRDEDS